MNIWTTELTKQLKDLNEEGYSATDMASWLSHRNALHMTRNMVIGKLKRLGVDMKNNKGTLATRMKEQRARMQGRIVQLGNKSPPVPLVEKLVEVEVLGPEGGVTLAERGDSQCAWPLPNGNSCGAPVYRKRASYCQCHHNHGHEPVTTRRQREARRQEFMEQGRFKAYNS